GIRDFHVTGVQTCALPISFDADFLQPLSTIRHAILAEMNPNNATIAGISINTVTIWDLVSGQILIETNSQHNSPVWSVAWSPTRSEERRVGKECRCSWSSC